MTGTELRRRRLALTGATGKPMSMQEFATKAGIGWTTLQRWETNRPRTQLEGRGLDPLRLKLVYGAIERLENGAR